MDGSLEIYVTCKSRIVMKLTTRRQERNFLMTVWLLSRRQRRHVYCQLVDFSMLTLRTGFISNINMNTHLVVLCKLTLEFSKTLPAGLLMVFKGHIEMDSMDDHVLFLPSGIDQFHSIDLDCLCTGRHPASLRLPSLQVDI